MSKKAVPTEIDTAFLLIAELATYYSSSWSACRSNHRRRRSGGWFRDGPAGNRSLMNAVLYRPDRSAGDVCPEGLSERLRGFYGPTDSRWQWHSSCPPIADQASLPVRRSG